MTMTAALMDLLTARALDVEALDKLGFDGAHRDGTDCLVIPFSRNGHVIRRKFRTFGPDRKFWQEPKGAPKSCWNEDILREDALISEPLIITEGELDAAAAIQCGIPRTISVPDGAPPANANKADDELAASTKYDWIREIDADLLKVDRVREIILATDGDENGLQLLHDLSHLLGRYRCKYLTYPKLPSAAQARLGRERCKDLNEVLQFYAATGVRRCVERARFVKVSGIFRMSELPPKPAPRIMEIQFDAFSDHYRMRLGDTVVVTGVPSGGKTTWVQDVVCRVVERYSVTAAWASFEQDPQVDHRRNFRRWYGRRPAHQLSTEEREAADAWIDRNHVFIVPDDEDDASLEWLIDKIETAVLRYGCQIVVIDPWNEMDHLRERHETLTEYTGRAIKVLKKTARRLMYHQIIIAHPSKMQRNAQGVFPMPSLYDISDSAHWFNKPDLGIVVHRESADVTIIKCAKSRYHDIIGKPGSVQMSFSRDEGRFIETERGFQ